MFVTYVLIALISFGFLIELVKFLVRRHFGVPKIKLKPFQLYRVNDKHGEITIWIRIVAAFLILFIIPAVMIPLSFTFLQFFIALIIMWGLVELLTNAHFEYWHSDTPNRAFVTLSEAGTILLAGILLFVFNVPELVQSLEN